LLSLYIKVEWFMRVFLWVMSPREDLTSLNVRSLSLEYRSLTNISYE
jgi:hypothetical protein